MLFRAIMAREVCAGLLEEICMCLVNGWRDGHSKLLPVCLNVLLTGSSSTCYKVPNSAQYAACTLQDTA